MLVNALGYAQIIKSRAAVICVTMLHGGVGHHQSNV